MTLHIFPAPPPPRHRVSINSSTIKTDKLPSTDSGNSSQRQISPSQLDFTRIMTLHDNDSSQGSANHLTPDKNGQSSYFQDGSRDSSSMSLLAEETSDFSDEESIMDERIVVHVEARQTQTSRLARTAVLSVLKSFIENSDEPSLDLGMEVLRWRDTQVLSNNLELVRVTDITGGKETVLISECQLEIHVYKLQSEEEVEEIMGGMNDDDEDDEDNVPSAHTKDLPSRDLEGMWDNLIYPDSLKQRLLDYIYSSLYFSEQEVDFGIISWNRLVLLHGPPGTGKTTLCRALAQKIAIRLSSQYSVTKLVEINSHSLFSKWFSESGKLVQKLFSHVRAMVEDERTFVVVMIDEVESLTAARSMAGSDPGDALRVVNALLTQLDKLKTRKNVLVLTTSNLSHTIDNAFIDRADIKEYVPLPSPQAIYWIFTTCFDELIQKGAVRPVVLLPWKVVERRVADEAYAASNGVVESSKKRKVAVNGAKEERSYRVSSGLHRLAETCHEWQLSGRVLRRLPLMAHARYLASSSISSQRPRSADKWLEALSKVVQNERGDREKIGWDKVNERSKGSAAEGLMEEDLGSMTKVATKADARA